MEWSLNDGGVVELLGDFVPESERRALFDDVHAAVDWRSRTIPIAGKHVLEPRLTAWIGDPDAVYTYSGRLNTPEAWPSVLQRLRERISERTGARLNSVLCNLYRDGRDSVGFHADAERELGRNPTIASLSLGATRRFQLRHRTDASSRLDLDLTSGSLLIMRGTLQHHYRHGVPKQPSVTEPRINLTFRHVHASSCPRQP